MMRKSKQNKEHRRCVFEARNRVKGSHSCLAEVPICRDGNWHFLDLECHNLNPNSKPFALECENKSSRLQRDSNWKDLLEWKRRNPEGEIFQVESVDEIDFNKLKKKLQFRHQPFRYNRGFVRR